MLWAQTTLHLKRSKAFYNQFSSHVITVTFCFTNVWGGDKLMFINQKEEGKHFKHSNLSSLHALQNHQENSI